MLLLTVGIYSEINSIEAYIFLNNVKKLKSIFHPLTCHEGTDGG
jgi:hypothetical protein